MDADHLPPMVLLIMLLIMGILVGGPNNIITSAVAADLASHPSIGGNKKALGTVTGRNSAYSQRNKQRARMITRPKSAADKSVRAPFLTPSMTSFFVTRYAYRRHNQRLGFHHRRPWPPRRRPIEGQPRLVLCLVLPHAMHRRRHGADVSQNQEGGELRRRRCALFFQIDIVVQQHGRFLFGASSI